MEHELSLNDILACLKKNWWKILIFAVLAAILMGCYTHFLIPKKYSSNIEFYIINTNESTDFSQTSILGAATILANDYIDVIKGDDIMNAACKMLEEKGWSGFSPDIIRTKMSSSTAEDSSLFTVKITDTDPERAYDIACVLAELAPPMITAITKLDELTGSATVTSEILKKVADNIKNDYPALSEQIKETFKDFNDKEYYSTNIGLSVEVDPKPAVQVNLGPKLAKKHESPSLTSNCIVAALIGALVSFAFFVIRSLINTIIRTEEDVAKSLSKYPLIGTVPFWDLNEKSSANKTNYRTNKY